MAGEEIRLRDAESVQFLQGLCSRSSSDRICAFETIIKTFDGWVEGYGSPKESSQFLNHRNNGHYAGDLSSDMKLLIHDQLPDILRLSLKCPFADVREKCVDILQDMKVSLFFK